MAIRAAFAAGLNDLLYVTGALALVGAVCALLLIRSKDFVQRTDPQPSSGTSGQASPDAASPVRSA